MVDRFVTTLFLLLIGCYLQKLRAEDLTAVERLLVKNNRGRMVGHKTDQRQKNEGPRYKRAATQGKPNDGGTIAGEEQQRWESGRSQDRPKARWRSQ